MIACQRRRPRGSGPASLRRVGFASLAAVVLCPGCAVVDVGMRAEPVRPNPFANVAQGMVAGGTVALGATYLWTRRDGWQSGDARPLALGTLYGTLAGGAIGLATGIADVAGDGGAPGYLVVRDVAAGSFLGATMGLLTGVVVAHERDDGAEPLAAGAAIGALAGAGLGVALGVFEATRASSAPPARAWSCALAPTTNDPSGWSLMLAGRF
jgi:hypothetical protein